LVTVIPEGEHRILPVCFYLPQFHSIPENDRWWGTGFTEWTMVRRGRPLFEGHAQPFQPSPATAWYNLLDREVRARQGALARSHGIYAFCYYHYWFRGKRLLEGPLERMLEDGEPALPFMLCWANEPWTRRWDGLENDVLQAQEYGDEADWREHFQTLLRFFRDPRYVRVDGAPVLLIYRTGHIPVLPPMVEIWRSLAREAGFSGLHLVGVLGSFEDNQAVPPEADAVCEFLPNWPRRLGLNGCVLQGVRVASAERAWTLSLEGPRLHPVQYRGAFASWDNTPRCGSGGLAFLPLAPARFRTLLGEQMHRILADPKQPAPFLFINAWNEWGEGCALEPDVARGTAYLEAVREALADVEAGSASTPRSSAAPVPDPFAQGRRVVVRVEERGASEGPSEGGGPHRSLLAPPEGPPLPARLPGSAPEDALLVRCSPLDPALDELALRADILVLAALEPELIDLARARHARNLPTVLDADALRKVPTAAHARVRRDLLAHARAFAPVEQSDRTSSAVLDRAAVAEPARRVLASGGLDAIVGLLDLAAARGTDPSRPPYRFAACQAARLLCDRKEPDAAIQALRPVLLRDDEEPSARSELGRALYLQGRSGESKGVLGPTLHAAPWHLRGWQYMLRLLAQTRDPDIERWSEMARTAHPSNYGIALLAFEGAPTAAQLHGVLDCFSALPLQPEEQGAVARSLGDACSRLVTSGAPLDQTEPVVARAAELCPESTRLADLHGQLLHRLGQRLRSRPTRALRSFAGSPSPSWPRSPARGRRRRPPLSSGIGDGKPEGGHAIELDSLGSARFPVPDLASPLSGS
jgi:hypothetical protein